MECFLECDFGPGTVADKLRATASASFRYWRKVVIRRNGEVRKVLTMSKLRSPFESKGEGTYRKRSYFTEVSMFSPKNFHVFPSNLAILNVL